VNGCAGRTLHDFETQAKQKIRDFISPSNMGRDTCACCMTFPINFDYVSQHSDDDDNDGLHFDDSRNRPRSSQANRRANAGRRNAVVTANDGRNDVNDNNNDNDDDDEAIWAVCSESLDSDPAIVLLCEGSDDEVHLHMVVWRRCPMAIGSAKCASRRLLRKRPLESWLLQNKFTTLVFDARRK